MIRLASLLTLVFAVAAVACYRKEPNYCEDVPVTHNCMDRVDAEAFCASNVDCPSEAPVCDLVGTKSCVQCTAAEPGACTSTTPVCGNDNTCRTCRMHSECASKVCLPDGSCSDAANVAYVAPGGSGNACTSAMPCGTLATALATSKPTIKIAAGLVKDTSTTTIDGKAVTIYADPGAKIDRDGDGPILEVKSANADVRIFDLEITGASGAAGANGIDLVPNGGVPKLTLTRAKISVNQGAGIAATGGMLTVTQSTISANTGGGLTLSSAQFEITNNFIAGNGGPGATNTVGGVSLVTVSGAGKFEFNTITANAGGSGVNSGVNCGTVTVPLVLANNIVYGNSVSGGGKQLGGSAMCTATYSDIGPDPVTGTGNINADPMFVNVAQGNYHLSPNSPCKDAADEAATLAVDVDGEARPQGPRRDIGADEYK